jgi:hypothetical protein
VVFVTPVLGNVGLWLFSKNCISAAFSSCDKRKFPLWILWKTAKVTNSPKARLSITLSAAVYTQTPQSPLLIAAIHNAKFFSSVVYGVSVCSVWGFRRGFFSKTAVRAKVPTNAAHIVGTVRFPWGCLCFFLKIAGRAHLHNRAAIVERLCGFEGFCGLNCRGYF